MQIYDQNGQPYEADLVDGEKYRRLERENAKLRTETAWRCFRCGDGSTPLYCLNCADHMLSPQIIPLDQ